MMALRGGQVVICATALLALAVGGWMATSRGPATRHPVPADRPALTIVGTLVAADGLGAAAAGFGDTWVDDRAHGRLLRLDAHRGDVAARIPVDGRLAISAGAGAVWALQSGGGYGLGLRGPLLKVDPRTDRLSSCIPLRMPTGGQALGFGVLAHGADVWVWGPNDVLRIDPRANRVAQRIAVGDAHGELTGLAVHGRQLLISTADGHLIRVDARTGAPLAIVAVALPAPVIRSGGGRMTVVTAGGSLASVDPATGRLVWKRALGFRVGTVIHAGGLLWANSAAVNDPGDRVSAVDPATGRVVASTVLPAFGTTGLVAANRMLWITAADGQVLVGRPSRAL
jgi:outer membrane protein assembly factor BamB